ncbi:MAG: hypothetical protein ACE5MK_13480 [Acidobacteriota bacterium]
MAWIYSLFGSSPEKQIERARKKVKEPHGDPATRINAAQRLREMGTAKAILALLDRFTINVSPSGQDEQEKLEVLSWIVEMRERAVEPLIKFLKRERQLYWPVKALRKIVPEDEFARKMSEILRYQWENPPASSDPKAQLIHLLGKVHSRQLLDTVKLFLEDEADDVRLPALDYLFKRPEDETREAILQCYLNSEERPRVRTYILERFSEKEWSVRGYRPKIEESLPEGYALTRDGKVKAMGKA